ncbi:hypothetical protein CsatA_022472 [Cannabis sativa]
MGSQSDYNRSLVFTYAIGFSLLLFTFHYDNINSVEAYDEKHKDSKMVSQKVNVGVYYEALNPSCSSFIVKNLAQIFDNGLHTIINLRLVPWGNAYFLNNSTNTTVCQNKHFALIYCFEFLAIEGRHKEWGSCFTSLGLPPKLVLDCFNSLNGTLKKKKHAIETAQLNPPHTILPWVVVDNQSIGNDYRNYSSYICKAYKGNKVPRACQ